MRNRLLNELAELASAEVHRRFIVEGTVQQYVLPDEAQTSATAAVTTEQLRARFAEPEIRALEQFLDATSGLASAIPFNDPSVNNEQLLKDAGWITARDAARKSIEVLKRDAHEWERLKGLR
jgi:hypothetical protein